MKSLFEQMRITYRHEGGCLIPNITLLDQENHPIGIWGERVPDGTQNNEPTESGDKKAAFEILKTTLQGFGFILQSADKW